ncbi:MAG: multidrug efflux MFS transporter [Capsulimonadaceae bacterium]
MEIWKRNVVVCWFGMFVTAIGMSQIAPVLPLFIKQLGVRDTGMIEQYSGIAFGVTFIVSAIFSPIWGYAADKYGRKPMLLRASLGMALIVACTGFSQNVYQLIALRLLMGVITGYSTACITLIATQTDKEHAGWALGTLSTSGISGSLLGPIIGGYIEENLGLPNVFFITGALMMVAFITTYLFVKEHFVRSELKTPTMKEVWKCIPDPGLTMTVISTFLGLMLAIYAIEPIVTVYVSQLSRHTRHLALLSGLAFSAPGLASILLASRLGTVADRIGPHKVILASLLAGAVISVPQAFVKNSWELIGLRFMLGLATAGLVPSINTMVKRITPDAITGRIFGVSMSAQYLGIFGGAIIGGQVAAYIGIRAVFVFSSVLLLLNALLVYHKVYKKLSASTEVIIDRQETVCESE